MENIKHYIRPNTSVTIITIIIALALIAFVVYAFSGNRDWISKSASILATVLMLFFLIQMPVYTFTNDEVIGVKQLIGKKEIDRKEIIQITKINETDISDAIRTFGSGGFGGYIGWFKNPTFGKFYMIASNTKDLLLIQTDTRNYVINCPLEKAERNKQ